MPGPAAALAGPGRPRRGRITAALAALTSCAVALGCGASAATTTTARSPSGSALVPIGAGLRGPASLQASVYAHGPATTATFAFDPSGRLWLTAAGLETHGADGVYMLPSPGARPVRVISGLDDPIGLLWHDGELYVSSVGRVDAYGSFDGTRFRTHRTVLDGPLAGAENNAIVLAPDGRLIMGVSAICDHCRPASRWSGSIVSFDPGGGGLRLYAARVRAPVGLAYLPGTGQLLVSNDQRDDLGSRTPGDTLAVIGEGQQWGFPECYGQGGAACDGVPSALAVLDPHAGVGPVAVVTGQLGAAIGTSAIVSEWETAKVARVALSRTSSGLTGAAGTMLTGIAHPLALALAPDGALLVGDWATGTIYRVTPRD